MNVFIPLTILLVIVGNCKGDIDVNTLFVTKVLVTYNEALQTCKSRGMVLVRINSAEAMAVVNGYANKVLADSYWIDGNDYNVEGTWVDSKGIELTYKNFGPNEPNGGRNENCVNVLRVPSGLWNDMSCVARLWAICQRNPSRLLGNQLEIEGSGFLVSKGRQTFAEAQEYCNNRGMRIIRIGHALDNAVLHSFARETNCDHYWIDANDIATEGKWVDTDGRDIPYRNFHPGEPNGGRNENCGMAYMNIDGLWNDFPCHFQLWTICHRDGERNLNADINAIIASHDRFTFTEAQEFCKSLGMRMVRANHAADNGLIHGFARRIVSDLYWLDGNDAKVEGRWVDSDENELRHKGFHPGEPNGGVNENCLNGYLLIDGLWNDFPCTLKNLFAFCARDNFVVPYTSDYDIDGDNMMISVETYTYNEAIQFCRTRGTQLVRVRTAADNAAIAAFAKKVMADNFWIDGNDHTVEGTWVDSSGKFMQFRNWENNEPNGGRGENCISSHNMREGRWIDVGCSNKFFAMCSRNPFEDDVSWDVHYARTRMTFDFATSYCKSIGLRMVRIRDSEADRLYLGGAIRHRLDSYWIDGNDIEQEDRWVDSARVELSYRNFAVGEPSGGRERNCLYGTKEGKWMAKSCTNLYPVICASTVRRIVKF